MLGCDVSFYLGVLMRILLTLMTILTSSMGIGQDKIFEASCETYTVKYERYDIYVEGGSRIVVMQYDGF